MLDIVFSNIKGIIAEVDYKAKCGLDYIPLQIRIPRKVKELIKGKKINIRIANFNQFTEAYVLYKLGLEDRVYLGEEKLAILWEYISIRIKAVIKPKKQYGKKLPQQNNNLKRLRLEQLRAKQGEDLREIKIILNKFRRVLVDAKRKYQKN